MDGAAADNQQITSTCAACGADNHAGALFCSRCTAPLAVAALNDLDSTDLQLCRAALFEVLAEIARSTSSSAHIPIDESLWRGYLSAFWLRPETALILYAEAMAVRSLGSELSGPWLDLGCGDGIHAALRMGWRFDSQFDAFQSLDLQARDIYHHWDRSRFAVGVERPGGITDFGIDIKPTAVERARALGVFGKVECADACKLPMQDGSVGAIFSNMLRDLAEPLPGALGECRRVLRDDGTLLLSAMTPNYAGSLYFVNAARAAQDMGDSQLAGRLLRLDRGRSVFCRQQLSLVQWELLLKDAGLRIAKALPIVSPAVIRFWDIGLRPFTTALLQQRQAWEDAGVLGTIKSAAVDLIHAQLAPLLKQLNAGADACMNILVVKKA
jgi:SAM-dependent methyltransferase